MRQQTTQLTETRKRPPNPWLRRPVLLLVCVGAGFVPLARFIAGTGANEINLALAIVFLVLLLFGYVRRPPFLPLWISAIFLLPLGAYLSGTNSSVRSSLTVGVLLAIVVALGPPVLTRVLHDTPSAIRRIITCFLVAQGVSASVGVLQLLGITVLDQGSIFGRSTGLAGHPNVLGLMSGIAAIISFGVLVGKSGAGVKVLATFSGLLNFGTLVATGSLSAMLATGVSAVFVILAIRRLVSPVFIAFSLLFTVIPTAILAFGSQNALVSSVLYRIDVVTGEGDGSGGAASLDIRQGTYDWAWAWIKESPLAGVGLDPMNAATFDGVTVVHNYLLRGWYQGGAPVALWLAILTLVVIVIAVKALWSGEGDFAIAVLVLMLVFAATAAFLNQPNYWLIILFAFAALSRHEAHSDTRERDHGLTQPVPKKRYLRA